MANRNVAINIQNGALGQLAPSEDGLCGLILQSAVAPASLALLTPAQIFSLAEAEALGITAAFDTANTVVCHKVLREFYSVAPSGTPLWIMFTAQTVTQTVAWDVTNEATYFGKLQTAAGGKIRMMSMVRSHAGGYTAVTTAGVDADVLTAMTKAQALVEEFRSRKQPFACIVPGHYYQANTSTLQDISTYTHKWVAGLIGDTVSGVGCAIGLLLGRLANTAVDTEPGKVSDGAMPNIGFFHNTTAFDVSRISAAAAIETKGWITMSMYPGISGFFFTNGWTATSRTDDYDRITRVRIIQKAERIVYDTYVRRILDDIKLDSVTGRMSGAAAKDYEQIIQRALDNSLIANEEASGVSVQIDHLQNVLSTGQVKIDIRITPDAYANEFIVSLGFNNPANS
jgi:hypothetical protein